MKNIPYHIILADDHLIVRQGIKKIIDGISGLRVIGEAGNGLELLSLLQNAIPDMVILDISMPNLRGIEATREIKVKYPALKVLILTMHKDKELLDHALSMGADGYMLKEDSDQELHKAIKKIRQGGVYITPRLTEEVLDHWAKKQYDIHRMPLLNLTKREKDVLKLIVEGKTSKEIASALYISVRTCENHKASIMKKLGMKKTTDLLKYLFQKGYLS